MHYTTHRREDCDKHYADTCASFGPRLRMIREARKMTQMELARQILAQKCTASIGHYEKGRTLPSVDRLVLLARALRTSPDVLLGFAPWSPADAPAPASPFA